MTWTLDMTWTLEPRRSDWEQRRKMEPPGSWAHTAWNARRPQEAGLFLVLFQIKETEAHLPATWMCPMGANVFVSEPWKPPHHPLCDVRTWLGARGGRGCRRSAWLSWSFLPAQAWPCWVLLGSPALGPHGGVAWRPWLLIAAWTASVARGRPAVSPSAASSWVTLQGLWRLVPQRPGQWPALHTKSSLTSQATGALFQVI